MLLVQNQHYSTLKLRGFISNRVNWRIPPWNIPPPPFPRSTWLLYARDYKLGRISKAFFAAPQNQRLNPAILGIMDEFSKNYKDGESFGMHIDFHFRIPEGHFTAYQGTTYTLLANG